MRRYKVNSFDHLKACLAELNDDPTKHWNEYPCLEWDRSTSAGYGTVWIDRKNILAHRMAFQLTHGPLAPGIHTCHHCDNPPCFRPIHLFAGTRSDNMKDSVRKGRFHRAILCGNEHWAASRGTEMMSHGEGHHKSKLSAAQVIELKSLIGQDQRQLAKRFGITQSSVWAILNGKSRRMG